MTNGSEVLQRVPGDFSLEKYDATASFKLQDWAANLAVRCYLRHVFRGNRKQAANYFIRNPLLSVSACREYLSVAMGGSTYWKQVFDLSTFDALYFNRLFGENVEVKPYIELYEEYWKNDEKRSMEAYAALTDKPFWKVAQDIGDYDSKTVVHVVVDVRAPESLLVEAFKTWLRETKAAMGVQVLEKPMNAGDLTDLQRFQVLAYLDLEYWATSHGHRLTQQALGLAIFPGEFAVSLSERIRKVVAPLARRACSVDLVDSFHLQLNMSHGKAREMEFLGDNGKTFLDDPEEARSFLFGAASAEAT